jgi:hypothetical protein
MLENFVKILEKLCGNSGEVMWRFWRSYVQIPQKFCVNSAVVLCKFWRSILLLTLTLSHLSTHLEWNSCAHGSTLSVCRISKSHMHTTHVVWSEAALSPGYLQSKGPIIEICGPNVLIIEIKDLE